MLIIIRAETGRPVTMRLLGVQRCEGYKNPRHVGRNLCDSAANHCPPPFTLYKRGVQFRRSYEVRRAVRAQGPTPRDARSVQRGALNICA